MLKTIFWILLTVVVTYVVVVVLLFALQKRLVFHPHQSVSQDPGDMGLDYEETTFTTEDGVALHGWYIPKKQARGTVLFLHGNAGNIADRMDTILQLHRLELNLFIFDYRGYGRSEGSPSEKGLYRDARAAYDYLIGERRVETDRLIIMGRSLGGAVAAWLAAHVRCRLVILESTFTSAPEVAADIYPFLPARYMIRYVFPVKQWVDQIRVPLLIAHSKNDKLIPYAHGQKLYHAAHAPKKFLELQGEHATATHDSGEKYEREMNDFLRKYLPPDTANQ